VIGDAESARAEARWYKTVPGWHERLQVRTGGAAIGTSLIPGMHGAGVVFELPYLLRLMGRGAIGTGELLGAEVDAEADLLAIFALWSGAINASALAAAVGGVVIVEGIAYPAFGAKVLAMGLKVGVKAAASHADVSAATGAVMGHAAGTVSQMLQPVFGKVLAKISAKITAKFGAKAVAGFLPVLGACANAGISVYILNEFLTAARIYYEYKVEDTGRP
jgi:hypothetical protein